MGLNKSQKKNLPADLPGMFEVQMNLLRTDVGKSPDDKTMSGTGRSPGAFQIVFHKQHQDAFNEGLLCVQ